MKQQLYINQMNYMLAELKVNRKRIEDEREKGDLTEVAFKNAKSRMNGEFQALSLDPDNDIHEQIMKNLTIFFKGQNDLKGKINYLNDNDGNLPLFYMLGGAVTKSLILLTIYDNAQSCCPINKEIVLNLELHKLEKNIEDASKSKDKGKLAELKKELVIISKLYQDNLKFL